MKDIVREWRKKACVNPNRHRVTLDGVKGGVDDKSLEFS